MVQFLIRLIQACLLKWLSKNNRPIRFTPQLYFKPQNRDFQQLKNQDLF